MQRIQQLYGYMVCLIAIVTLLISTASLVNALFDRTRPSAVALYGESESFESYRLAQLERVAAVREKTNASVAIPTDSALRVSYDTQRETREAYARWNAMKSMVTSTLMIIIALVLFIIHWRWLRGLRQDAA